MLLLSSELLPKWRPRFNCFGGPGLCERESLILGTPRPCASLVDRVDLERPVGSGEEGFVGELVGPPDGGSAAGEEAGCAESEELDDLPAAFFNFFIFLRSAAEILFLSLFSFFLSFVVGEVREEGEETIVGGLSVALASAEPSDGLAEAFLLAFFLLFLGGPGLAIVVLGLAGVGARETWFPDSLYCWEGSSPSLAALS